MASSNSPLLSSPSSIKDLKHWVMNIGENLDSYLQVNTSPRACIFQLPQTLATEKPECYLPQHIGLGPIHHFRPDLYLKQEHLKLITTKTFQNPNQIPSEFEELLFETVKKLVPQARRCYDFYFETDDDTLAWIFALDCLFLLDVLSKVAGGDVSEYVEDVMMLENQIPFLVFVELLNELLNALQVQVSNPDYSSILSPSGLDRNRSRRRISGESNENEYGATGSYKRNPSDASDGHQNFLSEVGETPSDPKFSAPVTQLDVDSSIPTLDEADEVYEITTVEVLDERQNVLLSYVQTQSNPTGIPQGDLGPNSSAATGEDLLLSSVETPSPPRFSTQITQPDLGPNSSLTTGYASDGRYDFLVNFCESRSPLKLSAPKPEVDGFIYNRFHLLDCMYHFIIDSYETPGPKKFIMVSDITLLDAQNAVQMAGSLFPAANVVLQPILLVLKLPWDKIGALFKKIVGENPIAPEIDIPSASKLSRIGKIEFCATPGGIHDIEFDEEKLTFCLPALVLKSDSEVILRNLVAYEGLMFKKGTIRNLVLTEYVDLMCGIIDSVKDVKILREKNIIYGNMGDVEIVKIFNGITKSSEKKDGWISDLQKTIDKVNKHYGDVPRVKAYRFVKKLFLKWWKFFAFVFPFLSIILLIITGVCQVYECKGHFGFGNARLLLAYATGYDQISDL